MDGAARVGNPILFRPYPRLKVVKIAKKGPWSLDLGISVGEYKWDTRQGMYVSPLALFRISTGGMYVSSCFMWHQGQSAYPKAQTPAQCSKPNATSATALNRGCLSSWIFLKLHQIPKSKIQMKSEAQEGLAPVFSCA